MSSHPGQRNPCPRTPSGSRRDSTATTTALTIKSEDVKFGSVNVKVEKENASDYEDAAAIDLKDRIKMDCKKLMEKTAEELRQLSSTDIIQYVIDLQTQLQIYTCMAVSAEVKLQQTNNKAEQQQQQLQREFRIETGKLHNEIGRLQAQMEFMKTQKRTDASSPRTRAIVDGLLDVEQQNEGAEGTLNVVNAANSELASFAQYMNSGND